MGDDLLDLGEKRMDVDPCRIAIEHRHKARTDGLEHQAFQLGAQLSFDLFLDFNQLLFELFDRVADGKQGLARRLLALFRSDFYLVFFADEVQP